MVRPASREDLAEVALAEGAPRERPVEPPHGDAEAPSSTATADYSSLHHRERSSPVKNRMREFCTSGSVRGGDGNVPTYSADQRSQVLLGGSVQVAEGVELMDQALGVHPT